MRKLILSMNLSLDGFLSGPKGELDWHFKSWSPDMAQALGEQLARADTLLLGRSTYQSMAAYWPWAPQDPGFPREDQAYAAMMNGYRKLVFSQTLDSTHWNNSQVVKGNPLTEILRLKKGRGRHLMLYGSARLAIDLVGQGLVDEYHLWVHPVILGRGIPLFHTAGPGLPLNLQGSGGFDSGVTLFLYRGMQPIKKSRSLSF